MWEPEPGWQPLAGGTGPSTLGVWRARVEGRDVVVKRLLAPRPEDPAELSDPRHFAWWRRSAEVAAGGVVGGATGLRPAEGLEVHEDQDGITLVHAWVPEAGNAGLFVARCLGRFAGTPVPDVAWLARDQLRDRLGRTARRGGWPTLARTTVADVADHLWRRRTTLLDAVDGLPQVLQHGDPVPGNLPGRDGADVVAVDWGTLGTGPVGSDLGYFALSAREGFDPLLEAYCGGLPAGTASPEQVALAARVTVAYTVLSRAEWALARVAGGEGALAGKYRHPAVAPHLRALQRQFPVIEPLLG